MTSHALHAVLLAAGQGSRLRPLTDDIPKPLLPIDGRAVLHTLTHELDAIGVAGYTAITGYNGDVIGRWWEQARGDAGTVRWVDQEHQYGSAHALQCALDQGLPHVDAVVSACDTDWQAGDLARIVDTWRERRPMVTMGLRRWPLHELPHRSCVDLDGDLVKRVLEKPSLDEVTSALSGSPFYVFRADFWPYVAAVTSESGTVFELADALQSAIDDGHEVVGVEVHGTRDITLPHDLLRHNFPYLNELLKVVTKS